MSKYVIDSSTLTSIADAVRAKTGSSSTIKVSDIPSEISKISGGGDIPEALYTYTGDCQRKFSGSNWNWVLTQFKDQITTNNITNANYMFLDNETLYTIPFDFNFRTTSYSNFQETFRNCHNLETIGDFNIFYPYNAGYMFKSCNRLRYLPNFKSYNFNYFRDSESMFEGCWSLRSISKDFLSNFYLKGASDYQASYTYKSLFDDCRSLDEVCGLAPQTQTITSNAFSYCFSFCCRVKDITFAMQDNGTPFIRSWKSQFIDLTSQVGYANSTVKSSITGYNSGITSSKQVTSATTYQALKNDPDWFTIDVNYSRYNHDSAVNTINSLPDTSAYLASVGGTNRIKFEGASGSKTDGGAISNLTAEEVAVATAKGWTVILG